MSLHNSFIITILDRFKEDHSAVLVDKVHDSLWYIGLTNKEQFNISDPVFWIFKLTHTDSETAIEQVTQSYSKKWEDREALFYNTLSEILLSPNNMLMDPEASIGDTLAEVLSFGGTSPHTCTIITDTQNKFNIVENTIQYKNKVVVGDNPSVTIRSTDNEGNTFDKTFDFIVEAKVPGNVKIVKDYNRIEFTYPNTTTDVFTYKKDGEIVSVATVVYSDSSKRNMVSWEAT